MKTFICVASVAAIILLAVLCVPQTSSNTEFLRIHIRADSNSKEDQNVKYIVKQAVVEYLTPYLSEAATKQQAMSVVKKELSNIKDVCDKTLVSQGKTYKSSVKLCAESFPDRTYSGITLPAGVYDALIIELGSGSGNNWWCVVYPPLCFVGENTGGGNVFYKSKLAEIIRNWKQSHPSQ